MLTIVLLITALVAILVAAINWPFPTAAELAWPAKMARMASEADAAGIPKWIYNSPLSRLQRNRALYAEYPNTDDYGRYWGRVELEWYRLRRRELRCQPVIGWILPTSSPPAATWISRSHPRSLMARWMAKRAADRVHRDAEIAEAAKSNTVPWNWKMARVRFFGRVRARQLKKGWFVRDRSSRMWKLLLLGPRIFVLLVA